MADFRERGNQLFAEKRYSLAGTYYGKAIVAHPNVATNFTNRALCYIKLNQWNLAVEDCQKAIQLDQNLIKAHFFFGLALTELESFDDAIMELIKANDLAWQQRRNFGEDIASAVRHAKKMRWRQIEEKRLQQQSDLHTFLLTLLHEHMERHVSLHSGATPSSDCKALMDKEHVRCNYKMMQTCVAVFSVIIHL
ncbi:STIP1 homology and U box-containing protein 1 [Geodia barretti]|uniref:RING-type E3 ubiquitin transferase n=1 Tax=Geodia barretti TaxID=519541 RepID=A0AA35WX76_GEOBA|nr:STIP1 homology and U box-containing protein 1 [Geodia barretti]